MAEKKFYAVKVGRKPGIYKTWNDCKSQVDGFKGALYKSFPSEEEARLYVYGATPLGGGDAGSPKAGSRYNIYVDGSYRDKLYSWAFVVYDGADIMHKESGLGADPEAAVIHNIAGELEAAVMAIQWAKRNGVKPITIHHDYIGISEWAKGWKTNNKFTQAYAAFVRPYLDWVSFNKVAGHSGVAGNELADKLAGEALRKQE